MAEAPQNVTRIVALPWPAPLFVAPTNGFAMLAATGGICFGLWYPAIVAAVWFAAGIALLPETFKRHIDCGVAILRNCGRWQLKVPASGHSQAA